jgi:hypothetical protein
MSRAPRTRSSGKARVSLDQPAGVAPEQERETNLEAPAAASIIILLVFSVSPLADPLAEATP